MAGPPAPMPAHVYWARELAVPLLMLGGIGLFVYDSLHLSLEALLLPAGLIAVIVASLLWVIVDAARRPAASEGGAGVGEDEAPGPILNARAWLLVALPAVLFLLLDVLGTVAALTALVFGAQLVFSAKAPWRSLLIAIAVTAPTYALFKYVLYARFAAGALGLG